MAHTVPDPVASEPFLPVGITVRRYSVTMRVPQDDDVAWHPSPRDRRGGALRQDGDPASALRTYGLVAGFVLAAGATAAVFLTDNPRFLRLAVIVAAWAFVLAAFLADRRRAETQAAADREEQIRRTYERELERDAAAHREYEPELENELRRETEQTMRAELTALREGIAGFSGLRDEVARFSGLRDELAELAALRSDVASLAALREDLTQLAELRADMGRLRAELTEQLDGEMLIERILLRTQSIRTPADAVPAEAPGIVEVPAPEEDDRPPRELTGGWPAVPLGEPSETRQAEGVRVHRPPSPLAWSRPPRPSWEQPDPGPGTAALAFPAPPAAARSRHAAEPDHVPTPHDPPHDRSGALPGDVLPPPPPRRRHSDDPFDDCTAERPVSPATSYEPIVRPSPSPRPTPGALVPDEADSAGHQRLAEILADNGGQSPSGRRRRRYRDEGEPDDVLARVLGGS